MDALEYLRRSPIAKYRKGEWIYRPAQPANGLYLIIGGLVEVRRITSTGKEADLGIYTTDEFFGESALIGVDQFGSALAVADTAAMCWSRAEMEDNITREPRLGIALMQMLVARTNAFWDRIESFAIESVAYRLARTLLGLSERLGEPQPNGMWRMPPLSQGLLARYAGTSRDVVTHQMAKLRRKGFVLYTRECMQVRRDELEQWVSKPRARPASGRVFAAPDSTDGLPGHDHGERTGQELLEELRAAEKAFRHAAAQHEDAILEARASGFVVNADGQYSLHTKARAEREALEQYRATLKTFGDSVRQDRRPGHAADEWPD